MTSTTEHKHEHADSRPLRVPAREKPKWRGPGFTLSAKTKQPKKRNVGDKVIYETISSKNRVYLRVHSVDEDGNSDIIYRLKYWSSEDLYHDAERGEENAELFGGTELQDDDGRGPA